MQLREREREESMIRPLAIDHIVLRTDRYEELINFYVDALGCNIERETAKEFGLTQLRAGNALIDIVDVRSHAKITSYSMKVRLRSSTWEACCLSGC